MRPHADPRQVVAASIRAVKMWAKCGRGRRRAKAASASVVNGDLLDKVDDAAPQFGVGDAHECFGESQAVRSGEKVGNVSGRGRLAHAVGTAPRPDGGRAFENLHLEDLRDLLKATRADAVGA